MPHEPLTAEDKYINKLYYLKKNKRPYELTEGGSTALIEFTGLDGKKKKSFYVLHNLDSEVPIRTICADVKRDCRAWLHKQAGKLDEETQNYDGPNPEYLLKFKKKHFWRMPGYEAHERLHGIYLTTETNDAAIAQFTEVGQILHEIDINACYWTIAYNLGFITYTTYKKYLKAKAARNIAIGNLRKTKTKKIVHPGQKAVIKKISSAYSSFNDHIVLQMHMIYKEVEAAMLAINKPIYYFKTDAFLVEPSPYLQQIIKKILDKYKLQYKVNRYKILEKHKDWIRLQNVSQHDPKTGQLKEKHLIYRNYAKSITTNK